MNSLYLPKFMSYYEQNRKAETKLYEREGKKSDKLKETRRDTCHGEGIK
jgi:hypothetical protein